ncbi:LacI family DNA-binding transcriptional regulator [Frigidibacter sp. ROC022]|uniref:LacI family DNA-binding transcriptional regulator n=1 Tax=Frigidibacter sp. ROC022 TaxID=2971796 RepID=UPI00215B412D|nr:LacI family DNA-binding transcriptional regulator [Frigidibacter sp. ROC022]MCR8723540.1 LacI family transcriptional regulator [Frigidibacter sp. ROC022]
MRATIKSIARDLGISHMTVSRALSGNPNVNPETRDLILARAKEVGYVKNSAANAMRGDPTAIVGLLLPNIINEFYARFANALAMLCADLDLDLVIHLTNDDYEREQKSLLRLRALQASTVILVPAPDPSGRSKGQASPMRIVELIRSREGTGAWGKLLIDDGPAIAAAVAHLVRTGRRRIAFIGADPSMSSGRGRLAAFESALQSHGQTPDPGLVRTGAPGFMMGHDNMAALLSLEAPPDALICGGFEISNGALDCCLRRGLRFPQDLAFVGYGDPISYGWIDKGISTIEISPEELAKQACRMLAPQAMAAEDHVEHLPTTFHLRGSAAAADSPGVTT